MTASTGFDVAPELWVRAGRGVDETSSRLADGVDAFCRAVGGQPFGSDDLGRALFEGFVRRRDGLLKDLPAAVNLLRGMGAGLVDAGGWYITADGTIVDELGGRPGAVPPPGLPPGTGVYRLQPVPDGLPSTISPPDIWLRASWFFETAGLGFAWPDGDVGGVGALRDAATTMAAVVDEVACLVADHSCRVSGSGSGAATDAFDKAARVVHGEGGLLADLKQRCEELAAYCRKGIDAIIKAQWHFVASAVFVVGLMVAVSMLGPLVETGLIAALGLIRREGEALRIILRLLIKAVFEAAVGAVFSGGLDVIDQLFRTGHIEWGEVGGALGQGLMVGGLMGGAKAGLPVLLRRGPALTRLANAMESPGFAGVVSRFAVGLGVGTGAVAVTSKMSGHGWDWEHAVETGFGMALIGAGGETITHVRNVFRAIGQPPPAVYRDHLMPYPADGTTPQPPPMGAAEHGRSSLDQSLPSTPVETYTQPPGTASASATRADDFAGTTAQPEPRLDAPPADGPAANPETSALSSVHTAPTDSPRPPGIADIINFAPSDLPGSQSLATGRPETGHSDVVAALPGHGVPEAATASVDGNRSGGERHQPLDRRHGSAEPPAPPEVVGDWREQAERDFSWIRKVDPDIGGLLDELDAMTPETRERWRHSEKAQEVLDLIPEDVRNKPQNRVLVDEAVAAGAFLLAHVDAIYGRADSPRVHGGTHLPESVYLYHNGDHARQVARDSLRYINAIRRLAPTIHPYSDVKVIDSMLSGFGHDIVQAHGRGPDERMAAAVTAAVLEHLMPQTYTEARGDYAVNSVKATRYNEQTKTQDVDPGRGDAPGQIATSVGDIWLNDPTSGEAGARLAVEEMAKYERLGPEFMRRLRQTGLDPHTATPMELLNAIESDPVLRSAYVDHAKGQVWFYTYQRPTDVIVHAEFPGRMDNIVVHGILVPMLEEGQITVPEYYFLLREYGQGRVTINGFADRVQEYRLNGLDLYVSEPSPPSG
ncbi:hypothetical protein [Actinoallomurus iriomotensis]|uniref:Outer membrane channel protein CpnT-like N-terminal domain-containing protein n=1 Tax=Actinoallomurus iriomotensis TaxID=478107 RepID=A0A9W6S5T4_9ACTN|nr:hypothetical protein [Actinoallomurus iriomotensis]GLY86247.1 hypothetical protein Airi02_041760 [Actinoallomurus iriomotensis]